MAAGRRPDEAVMMRILADLRAGMTATEVARTHEMTREAVGKYAKEAGISLRRGRPGGSLRPPKDLHELRGGDWVRDDRGVQRWVPWKSKTSEASSASG